jgi:hypothetical protein
MMAASRSKDNKYHNKPVKLPDGRRFDSTKEYRRWEELLILERAGKIRDLRRQVPFELIPKTDKFPAITYVADFVYFDERGTYVVEDVKSKATADNGVYKNKKIMMYYLKRIEIKET